MSSNGWEGLGSLGLLARLSTRARVRRLVTSLRQPKRLILLIVGIGLIGFFAFFQSRGGNGNPMFSGENGAILLPLFLSFFFLSTSLGALANGTLIFTPPEVQLLFPAPIGTRALLLSRVLSSSLKSATAAIVFTVVLRPEGAPLWRVGLGYLMLFETLVLLAIAIDLCVLGMPRKRRRSWALVGALVTVAIAAITIAVSYQRIGHWSYEVFLPLGILARPWTAVLVAPDPTLDLAICIAVMSLLLWPILGSKRPIREQAGETSEQLQKKLRRLSKGSVIADKPQVQTNGKLLPSLPSWGGAGPHVWRQLSVLRRKGAAFGMMVTFTIIMGLLLAFAGHTPMPEAGVGAMLGMLLFMGPYYVNCDFRSDYDNLAWLRSLPTSSTSLAAGQILASGLVLYAVQLLLTGWIVFVAPAEHRLWWLAFMILLPFLNVIQLCVENGAYLLYPFRLDYTRGPPGAAEMARLYALILAKMLALAAALGLAALPGISVAWFFDSPPAGLAVSAVAIVLETCLLVTVVGRIFRRVDPSRDLGQ